MKKMAYRKRGSLLAHAKTRTTDTTRARAGGARRVGEAKKYAMN